MPDSSSRTVLSLPFLYRHCSNGIDCPIVKGSPEPECGARSVMSDDGVLECDVNFISVRQHGRSANLLLAIHPIRRASEIATMALPGAYCGYRLESVMAAFRSAAPSGRRNKAGAPREHFWPTGIA
ncbi:hypothetical protein HDG33_007248 [Paraburkholderia sp. Cpub6]|nr:hypothetical protein [Paraburkholderia sp. Cpub6]